MTNPENQKRLDRKKFFESQKLKEDQSGKMDYCGSCNHQKVTSFGESTYCVVDQARREKECACATAYNRMIRKNREKGIK